MSTSTAHAPARRRPEPETDQLALLEVATPTWRLDRRTREVGRRGVASAREALRRAGSSGAGEAAGGAGDRRPARAA